MDTIAEAVVHRLTSTRNAIKWAHLPDLKYVLPYIDNSTAVLTAKPADGEEPKCKWQGDLRFTGEWWVCLEEREEALKKDQQMYEPLFVSSGKWNSKVEENQFLVELMKQLIYGRRYYFELIHIDNFPLTAERLHVFFFNGLLEILESSFIKFEEKCIIANRHIHGWEKDGSKVGENVYTALGDRRKRGKLEEESVLYLATLSFSICQINTAALFILLTALSTPKAGNLITNLDISFNLLDGNSFYTLSQLLPLTHVCRLSLRGNNLGCENTTSFREFLVDACSASHTSKPALNELDFSATQLSYKQVCVLIECIPLMKGLHQLLLDGVDIPSSKTSALKDAVSESNIYFLSLKNIPEISTNTIYLQELEEICERNRRRVLGANAAEDEGFFRKFFERGRQKGWRPTGYSALPEGYQPFTNNDPSLWLDN
ncbi:hypothetical protein, conserved [Angomonas deanei]|uniref:Leucine Rich repeat n=1 Tax=Angomonas deanei TaxID=59799 RepID=A0A7G2CA35_9TRYP|nr:hypothetical protein, conserved [Angomonas deanei]